MGIAFPLQNDMNTYDGFYLRPTNGSRRRSGATKSCRPVHLTSRLAVVPASQGDALQVRIIRRHRPAAWTKIKIEVRGERARLSVHDHDQPALIVNDVKSGAQGKGAVALWIGPGTVAHLRNLRVERLETPKWISEP